MVIVECLLTRYSSESKLSRLACSIIEKISPVLLQSFVMRVPRLLPAFLSCAVLAVALAGTPVGSQTESSLDRPEIAARVRVFNDLVAKGFSDAAVEFAAIGYLPSEAVQMGPDGVRSIPAEMVGRIEALQPWKPWGRHAPKAVPDNRAVTENPALLRGYIHTYNKFVNAGDDYAALIITPILSALAVCGFHR